MQLVNTHHRSRSLPLSIFSLLLDEVRARQSLYCMPNSRAAEYLGKDRLAINAETITRPETVAKRTELEDFVLRLDEVVGVIGFEMFGRCGVSTVKPLINVLNTP